MCVVSKYCQKSWYVSAKITKIKAREIKVAKNTSKTTSCLCALILVVLAWDFQLNLWIPCLCSGEKALILSHFLSKSMIMVWFKINTLVMLSLVT